MSSCQKDVKLSKKCQMSKNQTPRLWRRFTKKMNWHNEVHRYWRQFWRHKWWSLKSLKMFIKRIFGQFWWPSYLTSKLMSICVNLIMSIYFFLWTSSIVQMFDFLTFGIFLTTWHLFQHFDTSMKLKPPQPAQGYFYNLCQRSSTSKARRLHAVLAKIHGLDTWTMYASMYQPRSTRYWPKCVHNS